MNLNKIKISLFAAIALFAACKKDGVDRSVLLSDVPGAVLKLDKVNNARLDLNTPTDSSITISWSRPSYGKSVKTGYELQIAGSEAGLGSVINTPLKAEQQSFTLEDKAYHKLLSNLIPLGDSADIFMRIVSFPAYNQKAAKSLSNVVKLKIARVAPTLPSSGDLFLVGDAAHGWNNPVPEPEYKLVKYSNTVYGGRFFLNGGKEYLLLPENGNWGKKYCLVDGGKAVAGADMAGGFIFRESGGDNFLAPSETGWYQLKFDFATMEYQVKKDDKVIPPNPQHLYVVGDGTPESWTNTPSAAQKMAKINANVFEYTQDFVKDKMLKLLSTPGFWQPQYGQQPGAAEGVLGYTASSPEPDVIKTPKVDGKYKLIVDFGNGTYRFEKQ